MSIEIKDDLNVKEYNDLRKSVGWDVKDEIIVQKAINSSLLIKKAVFNGEAVGMVRVSWGWNLLFNCGCDSEFKLSEKRNW